MPYVLVSGCLTGPKFEVAVSGLKPKELADLRNFSPSPDMDNYTVTFPQHPAVILNALEVFGFRVVTCCTAVDNKYVWTMRKDYEEL